MISHETEMCFLAATCSQDLDVRVETESQHLTLVPSDHYDDHDGHDYDDCDHAVNGR